MKTTPDVVFGYNTVRNYAAGSEGPAMALRLDVYEPQGDVAQQRPLLLFAFGGAFLSGARTDAEVVSICQSFARKGYVAAAIDYRLLNTSFPNLAAVAANQANLVDEIIRAAADMKAAVRYFKHDAATTNTYHIDPTHIFLGGYSAGAITALQVAYTESVNDNPITTTAYNANGGLEGNTDLQSPDNLLPAYNASGIAGVLNIAGGVNSLSIVNAGNPPLYSAQGTADTTVPYDRGTIQGTQFTIYGSGQLQPQATTEGIVNQLHPVPGGNHSSPVTEPTLSQIIGEAAAFFQPLICAAPLPVTLTSFSGRVAPDDCTATLGWQTATERNSYAYEVQGSADGQAFAPLGTVPSRNRAAGASYSFRVGRLAELHYFRLRMLDTDGTAAYSPVVTLAGCGAGPLLVAPTPTRDLATVSGLPAGRCLGVLYSATGQIVAQASGTTTISLRLGSLPPGIYLLKVQSEGGAAVGTAKVVKE
ncbi:T9SS type A sorting domain-containing protein [Hymenobacter bucti]|uniref:T9SS type A sorting domain-containing protein n=1 Tax=Hymenobacter bucti TaxID=1844114 RepID=A0ABW4QRT1_9BACT